MEGLVFGWRTAVLALASAQLIALAIALTRPIVNRDANRLLAALLVVLVGIVTPWTIGFAGFYDRWRWLTFLPVAMPLAVAPLLWLYVRALTGTPPLRRDLIHLAPAAAHFAFAGASFLLPMPLKTAWADRVYPGYGITVDAGTIAGLAIYGRAALRLLADYRRGLAQQRSDDARYAARWLSRAIGAMFALLGVWAIYGLWDAVAPLGYFNLMGLYLAIAAVALYLAVEGWRHAALPFPVLAADEPETPAPARDWAAMGRAWEAEVRANGWAADPELSLAGLARRLGTNTAYLSRALNEGLGVGFSAFVNAIRSEGVAERLRGGDGGDLLALAFDAGFASKASFNRAFQARFGVSPSQYRRAHGAIAKN